MAGNDVATMLGVPELAPAPSAAPVAPDQPSVPAVPAGALDPRVVWTVGGEALSDLPGRQAVASVVHNRLAAGAPDAVSVVSEPGQFKAYQSLTAAAQRFPVGSPQYQALESQIAPIISGAQPPTVPYTGFRTHGYASPGAPWNGTSPIATIGGNDFATVPYKYAGGAGPAPSVADALGLSPQERAALITGPQPGSPEAGMSATKNEFTTGPQFGALSIPAAQTFHALANDPKRGIDPNASGGSAALPYYVNSGENVPVTAGLHWVDVNGKEHVNPGGALENAGAALAGLGQGLGMDTAASGARLGLGTSSGDPMIDALGQAFGGQSAFDQYQAANKGFQQQQQAYHIAHLGDPYAQAGRFAGQAIPAIAASLAAPEVDLPAALGGRVASGAATNALRGVVATAPSVGASSAPVLQQLGTGALAGIVTPAVTGLAGKTAQAVTGAGRAVSPEVAALADTAQTKYKIPLASGQVVGADGNADAKVAFSQALKNDPKAQALNQQQRQAWQRGVTNTYGDPSGDISPGALSTSRARIGGVMNDVAARTTIPPTVADAVQTSIGQVISDAQKVLPDNEVVPLLNMAKSIGDVRDANGISGDSYQALTRQDAPLDRLESSSNPNVAHYAAKIHNTLNDGLAASAAPEDVDALRGARWQYKNLQTVARAAQNQNNVGADGVLTPGSLNTATTSNFKGRAFQGAGDLDELNAIRNKLMTEPADSGTAGRLKDLTQTGLAGLATGGAVDIGLGLLHQPETTVPTALSALAGTGVKLAADALKRNKVVGSATNIIARSLPAGSPGAGGAVSALNGLRNASKAVEIPLSALAGVRAVGAIPPNIFNPKPAVAQ